MASPWAGGRGVLAVAKGTMLETLKINSSSKDDPPRPGGACMSSSHPSVPYLFIYPTIYPSIYPSIYLYISTTISLFLFLFLSLSLFLFLFLFLSFSFSFSPSPSIYLRNPLITYLSMTLSTTLSISLSISLSGDQSLYHHT